MVFPSCLRVYVAKDFQRCQGLQRNWCEITAPIQEEPARCRKPALGVLKDLGETGGELGEGIWAASK